MNGKELHTHSRTPVLVMAFILCLTTFGERALFATPAPQVRFDPPDVPPQVLIGEDFTFRVRFKDASTNAGDIGYGPFVDLVLDAGGANITKTPPCACDGMTFVQAKMIDVNGGAVPLVYHQSVASPCTSSLPVSPNHPFQSSGVSPVVVPAGSQLVTIELPFGSFEPSQPEIVVEVTAHLSNLADAGHALKIYARGGFRYGSLDALDNPNVDPPVLSDVSANSTQWAANEQTTPTVMIVSKKYLGPEDETATGPNFMRRYEIALDIATGQTVTNVMVTDHLPNNVAYHQMGSVSWSCPAANTALAQPTPNIAHNPPNQPLIVQCTSPTGITGVVGPDATIVFEFFIPELDANHQPVLSSACAVVQSINDIKAAGDWTPIDPCDTSPVHLVNDVTPADHTLLDKCLAIQKTVVDVNGGPSAHPIPGDTLRYTLNFQISDFRTIGQITVTDRISDGQQFLSNPVPTLTIGDQFGNFSGNFTPNINFSATGDPHSTCQGILGTTNLVFNVSGALSAATHPRLAAGILTGGFATVPPPVYPPPTTPAVGQIVFYAQILDRFQFAQPPGDQFVDKDDPLNNCLEIRGTVYKNEPANVVPASIIGNAFDDSKTSIAIVTDFLAKTVYAVNRPSLGKEICGPNTTPTPTVCSTPDVIPGDEVTYRLTKTIPSSDAENLTIQDWLPLPIFHAAGISFTNSQCGIPGSGHGCLGPGDTLSTWPGLPAPPTFTANPPSLPPNSIKFNYGTFNDPSNLPRTIDLLFTLTVSNDPFADGLYMTNEAQECESNTFGVTFCQAAIAQVHVREPALKITKGVVAVEAKNTTAVFSPPQAGPVTFQPPGASCPRFTQTINSTNLASTPINSDISNVDANDCITFAIVVENTGGSTAYDVKLHDLFPLGPTDELECFAPDFATLCVTNGAGTSLPFTSAIGGHGNRAITLQNPLPGVSSAPGSNIAVITFDACIVGNIKPHCCDNTAVVENYASTPGGPNFVTAAFGGPFQDSARICVLPKAAKSIKTTSEAHTPGTPSGAPLSPEQLAIGEIIRYHLEVVVPETTSASNYKVEDFLPAGLSYLPGTVTIFPPLPSGLTASHNPPLVTGGSACGISPIANPLFDFGAVTNTNNNSAPELIVLEFNALVCNIASNQNGTPLNNSFRVLVDDQQAANSNTVTAVVVEPNITIAKVAAVPSLTAGATATYTITLANNAPAATATAFDVHLTDLLPACLTNLTSVQIATSGGATGVTNTSTAAALNVTIVSIPVNGTVTVHYSATVKCVDCTQLVNTARVTWTSLPGPLGTITNLTTSSTPGASGLANGERDDSGGVNDYVASASATLCCMLVSNEKISCNPNGTFTYTFTLTNSSGLTVSGVSFSPTSPPNVTITPASTTGFPLLPGVSTTVTVTIGGTGAVSGTNICFTVVLLGGPVVACRTDRCITLPQCCVAPPSGMVAWWPLDETSGTLVADLLGNNNGTAMTGPIGGGNGPVSHPGKVNTALTFCNSPSEPPWFVTVPDHQVLNFGTAQSFSIDAWTFGGGATMIVDKLNSPNPSGGYRFSLLDSSNRLKLDIGNGSFTGTTAMPPFTWSHVAVTVDRGSPSRVTFYVNGTPEVAAGNPSSLNASSPGLNLLIGGTHDAQLAAGCESGVDEIEIFNRVLSQSEIQGIVNAGSSGKCKCLLVSNEKIDCNPNGTFTYTFTVTNFSNATASGVTFSPPAGVTITPGSITIPSLPPGASTTVTVTIGGSGAVSGATICFTGALVGQGAVICRTDHCITLPKCCVPPPSGMVSWWRAEGNANDSADGNHGVLQGNAAFAAGMVGSAFSFAAQGDYVAVSNAANLNFGNAAVSPALSIDAWIKTSSTATVLPIVDKRDLSGGEFGYSLFLFNGNIALQLGDGIFFNYISSGPDLRNGQFHHVAVTVDRTSPTGGKLYVDGAVVSPIFNPTNRPGALTNSRPLFIGQHATVPSFTFIGLIDEVEIFNRVLAQTEIQDISNAGPAGKCLTGSICVTKFEDVNRNGVQDPGEPLLSGWIFNVRDQNNVLVGTVTTNPPGTQPACLTVPPGTYTITEQVLPGWTLTTPNPRTVTVSPGQTVNLSFGNWHLLRRRAVRP